jgi:hypothetical protein
MPEAGKAPDFAIVRDRGVLCVSVKGEFEELVILSAKHRSWCVFDRVACLAERGENHFCNACLPEIRRASPAVFHGLGRKRSHLASAEMVRAEFVKFDQG